ncbi:MAG TPA: DUF2326 domain-containing protein, partial [Opitutae bacterium]|nr:DUF2326 domain-containing protein [Opitutae bacterium]
LQHPEQPTIIRNGQSVTFATLAEATRFLGDLLFVGEKSGFSSFRSLISLLMRDEESEFSDILRTMPVKKNAPPDRLPHLYLLGLDVVHYRGLLQTIKEIDRQTKLVSKIKSDLTRGNEINLKDIPAELNAEKTQVARIEAGLADLRAEPAFTEVEKDLNEIEAKLGALRATRKGVNFKIDQIRALPQPEAIDEVDLEIVFERARAGLGKLVQKSLEQARAFKEEIESFQRSLLNDELTILERQQRELNLKIRSLSQQHSEIVSRIDRKGTLRELSSGLKMAVHQQQNYHRRAALFQEYKDADQQKEDLQGERRQAIDHLRKELSENAAVEETMNNQVAAIHDRIMGNSDASFTLTVNTKTTVKQPLNLDLRILDDGSHSIDRTKVFIYDCALMFAECTQGRHPGFLLHDNIFDVDQDTLVQCLNYLQEQDDSGEDFQYILTLNREKIEVEERAKLIQLDVQDHCRASFTKANPFLGFRYQETRKASH